MTDQKNIPGRQADEPPVTLESCMRYMGAFLAGFGACSLIVIAWLASLFVGAM